MRTWHPYPNFAISAMVLSDEDLAESLDSARFCQSAMQGWYATHQQDDDVLFWEDEVLACMVYSDCLVRELRRRGVSTMWPELCPKSTLGEILLLPGYTVPRWLGDDQLHQQHRRLLLQSNPGWYGQWQWREA